MRSQLGPYPNTKALSSRLSPMAEGPLWHLAMYNLFTIDMFFLQVTEKM